MSLSNEVEPRIRWPRARDMKVLVVDDEAGVRESLADALDGKWVVLTAASGPEALALIEKETPEIVLADQRMSPMEGLALFEAIAKVRPHTRRILMTGYADLGTVIDGLNRDLFCRYVTKPWRPDDLQATLEEAASAYLAHVDRFHLVMATVEPLRRRLLEHPVYDLLTDGKALRTFMEFHCFAVWDFMSLLKCLQHKLTCLDVPWRPPANIEAARMINEIVVAEETDRRADGKGHASHFELYVEAMDEIGAQTDTLRRFTDLVAEGMPWTAALQRARVASAATRFVTSTLEVCQDHPAYEVASHFLFGRENLIPGMFRKIVEGIASSDGLPINAFRYYLDRHIAVDEEEHGPASERMMKALCGADDARWRLVLRSAQEALGSRLALWDGIADAIKAGR